jgi:hypothetical protein
MMHGKQDPPREPSSSCSSDELCGYSSGLPCVEEWCVPDEKEPQVEMPCVLLVRVSHRQCSSKV